MSMPLGRWSNTAKVSLPRSQYGEYAKEWLTLSPYGSWADRNCEAMTSQGKTSSVTIYNCGKCATSCWNEVSIRKTERNTLKPRCMHQVMHMMGSEMSDKWTLQSGTKLWTMEIPMWKMMCQVWSIITRTIQCLKTPVLLKKKPCQEPVCRCTVTIQVLRVIWMGREVGYPVGNLLGSQEC